MAINKKAFDQTPVEGKRTLVYLRRWADRGDYSAFVFAGWTALNFSMSMDSDDLQFGGAAGLTNISTTGAPTWTGEIDWIQSLSVAAQDLLEEVAISNNPSEKIQIWVRNPDVVAGAGAKDDTGATVPATYQQDRMAVFHITDFSYDWDPTAQLEGKVSFAMDVPYVISWLPPVAPSEVSTRLINDGLAPFDDTTRGGAYEQEFGLTRQFVSTNVDSSQYASAGSSSSSTTTPAPSK
jgi:hypothetical protein